MDNIEPAARAAFCLLDVSTDDVYGTLASDCPTFCETAPHAPNSPYAASKTGSDRLAWAYFHTFYMSEPTTNYSSNYGRFPFPEKLIPLMILNALEGKPLPVYGDRQNVLGWLFVEDHCAAIRAVVERGRPGETYNIGGNSERTSIDIVRSICNLVDEIRPQTGATPRIGLIKSIEDSPGHDRRDAIDATTITREPGWTPAEQFESGLRKTVQWYLESSARIDGVRTDAYRGWIAQNYAARGMAVTMKL